MKRNETIRDIAFTLSPVLGRAVGGLAPLRAPRECLAATDRRQAAAFLARTAAAGACVPVRASANPPDTVASSFESAIPIRLDEQDRHSGAEAGTIRIAPDQDGMTAR